ncbi:HAD family hydrolase [Umezawaea sp. NPDC059074]|uniref:HAD family hydrolase n=1 Tax=Umezawaea sp. NPDC059074 TaxID=3346716 RepID=UPI0036AFD465
MSAEELLKDRDHVLVALDGPVVEHLPELPVADRLRVMVAEDRLPRKVARTDDPFVVLAFAASIGPATEQAVYAQWRRIEHEVVAAARLTPGVGDAFAKLAAGGARITVVGSLDVRVMRALLVMHGLDAHVGRVAGRNDADRAALPPAPDLITSAIHAAAIPVESCVFVGTTKDDLAAARAAGVDTIHHERGTATPAPPAVVVSPAWFAGLAEVRSAPARRPADPAGKTAGPKS